MKKKKLILILVISIVLLIITGIGIQNRVKKALIEGMDPQYIDEIITVATITKKDIPKGTLITEDMVHEKAFDPPDPEAENSLCKFFVIGKVSREDIPKGTYIEKSMLSLPDKDINE